MKDAVKLSRIWRRQENPPNYSMHKVLQKEEMHIKIPLEDNEKQEGGIIPTILGKFLMKEKA